MCPDVVPETNTAARQAMQAAMAAKTEAEERAAAANASNQNAIRMNINVLRF